MNWKDDFVLYCEYFHLISRMDKKHHMTVADKSVDDNNLS